MMPGDGHKLDIFIDQSQQHLLDVEHDGVEIDIFWLEHLTAAEGEQLPAESGGALGALANVVGPLPRTRVCRPLLKKFGIAEDGGQDVVEIVRDSPRETSDRLHLL